MRRILLHIALLLSILVMAKPSFGVSWVTGYVLEQDGITPILGATVSLTGIAASGDTLAYQFMSDSTGFYDAEIEEGTYLIWASAEGYETAYYDDSLFVAVGWYLQDIDFVLHEIQQPVRYVAARQYANDFVRVSWSMNDPLLVEDFETGDFSRFNWNNTISEHPWVIDSTHAIEGQYCMKSACEGVSEGFSQIEVAVFVPWSGLMSFCGKISSEATWDVGLFYIDDTKMLECSGEGEWETYVYPVAVGEHVFRWSYRKDASTDDGDDCFYVDDIHFYLADSTGVAKGEKSFQYYDLFRRRFDETPVMLASHLMDTLFMDVNWNTMGWGKYSWGVSCYYEGNRGSSDTIWSAALDKDMATEFELDATTNVGLSAEGALVTLSSGSGHLYQGVLNADGHLSLHDVYRETYALLVQLDGFEDFELSDSIAVFAPTQIDIELEETVRAIDSLYVSSTGWAVWYVEGGRQRNLQYYEVKLDGTLVGTTLEDRFQFDVSALQAGQSCLAEVRPVYLSDTCAWASQEWMVRECSDFQGCGNLTWAVQDESVLVSWTVPDGEDLYGALVFRDGEIVAFVEDTTCYLDTEAVMHGTLEYCVRLVYDGNHDGTCLSMACPVCMEVVFPVFCDPPEHLEAENYWENDSDYGALVSWGNRPDPVESWLFYDNGTFLNSLGGNGDPLIFWGIRFDADELTEYAGTVLKHVALYDVCAGSYHLWIYVGGDEAPQNMVHAQTMSLTGSYAWHYESIAAPVEIPADEPLWIVVGQQGLSRPAAACADMGQADGRWVSLDGENWTDMHTFNMHYTWMLRAFVSNRSGRMQPLGDDGFVLQQYNLYRSFDNIDYQQITSVPAAEGQAFYQYRDVLTGTENGSFYYKLTALYMSEEGETCESEFAHSLLFPELDFVMVDDHWKLVENEADQLLVYPNPSTGRIMVRAEGMRRVTVFNALGQSVLDREVQADESQLDLSGFTGGIYQVLVSTEKGFFSKRFVLSK